jgi:hypothetical protein
LAAIILHWNNGISLVNLECHEILMGIEDASAVGEIKKIEVNRSDNMLSEFSYVY